MCIDHTDYLNAFTKVAYIDYELIKKSTTFFLGIDPSITNTGLVILNEQGILCGAFNFHNIFIKLHKSKSLHEDTIRRIFMMDNIFRNILLLFNHKKIHASIEGYSYASVGKLAQIGELCGSYKLILLSWDIDYLVIPPNNIKKYASGKGNADKEIVTKHALKELSNYDLSKVKITSDICDAYFIASMIYGIKTSNVLGVNHIKPDLYKNRINVIEQGRSGGFNGHKNSK